MHADSLDIQYWLLPQGQALVLAAVHSPGLVRDLGRQQQLQAQGACDRSGAAWAAGILGQAAAWPWRSTGRRAARAGKRQRCPYGDCSACGPAVACKSNRGWSRAKGLLSQRSQEIAAEKGKCGRQSDRFATSVFTRCKMMCFLARAPAETGLTRPPAWSGTGVAVLNNSGEATSQPAVTQQTSTSIDCYSVCTTCTAA